MSDGAAELDRVVAALEGKGRKPKRQPDGSYMALCPVHDDRTPSLSVKLGDSGKLLITCHACRGKFRDILDALGLLKSAGRSHGKGNANYRPETAKNAVRKDRPATDAPGKALPAGDGVIVYRYANRDGSPALAIVRREIDGGKKISQWRPVAGGLWIPQAPKGELPLYRLADVLSKGGRVAVVEGEKCADAASNAWPTNPTVAWAGGTGGWRRADWTPLANREVTLLADADEPGRKCMQDIAQHLRSLGCKDIRVGLPDGDSGDDVADWLAIGIDHAAATIGALLKTDAATPPMDDAPELDGGPLVSNEHYRLLGLAGERVAIVISAGKLLTRTREQLCYPNTLIAIAPQDFWLQISGSDNLGSTVARMIGDSILRAADMLGSVDLTSLCGRGAVKLDDGKIVWHLGDRLMLDGAEMPLDAGDPEKVWLSEPTIKICEPASQSEVDRVRLAVMAYRWATKDDGMRFLGWLACSVAGGALEWRPHLLLTAPAAQGKSWLLREVVQRLLGSILIRIADGTTASVARLTSHASLPIVIDEAEPSGGWVIDLLALIRIASGGEGLRLRADPSGHGINSQAPRFSALLSATAAPDLKAADATRLVPIRFGKEVENWLAVSGEIKASLEASASRIRSRLIMDTPKIARYASTVTDLLQAGGKTSSREALAAGALTGGWRFWMGGGNDVVMPHAALAENSDAGDALREVLAVQIKYEHSTMTIAAGLESGIYECGKMIADLYGVRYSGDDGALYIACSHRGLRNELSRSDYRNVDLRRLLLQIDGSTTTPNAMRFGAVRAYAVMLDARTLKEIGVEFSGNFHVGAQIENNPFDQ